MKILLELGGIRFLFDSDCDIMVEDSVSPFFCSQKNVINVNITLIHDFSNAPLPRSAMIGEDVLTEYYLENGTPVCLSKAGQGRYFSCCVASPDLRQLTCWLNFGPDSDVNTLGNILRMIPIRRILLMHGVLFIHASQISLGGTGILFSAPSQTGKTTQANLWRRHRGAELICNDRTLTDGCLTYGYPVDGSAPVFSSKKCRLGAIVLLEQAPVNTVRLLSPRKALARLMPQLVLDVWDRDSTAAAMDLLLRLMTRTPVYLLSCTPDEEAVRCLEQQLQKDGVITHENSSGPAL